MKPLHGNKNRFGGKKEISELLMPTVTGSPCL